MQVKLENIHSKQYAVRVGSGQGAGTFIIVRRSDDATTLRYVCSEGLETYTRIKRAWRQSMRRFNLLCAAEFEKGGL